MLYRRWLALGASLLLLFVIARGEVTAAPPALYVAIAEDMTQAARCLQWVDVPTQQRPCPPGSVIMLRITPRAAVVHRSPADYVQLTGHPAQDAQAMQHLASQVHARVAPQHPTPRACTAVASKTIGGSYMSHPSDANARRISYQVSDTVGTSCSVSNVQDRSRISAGTATWVQSCTHGGQNCRVHDLTFDSIWTSWRPEIGSVVGQQYTHVSYVSALTARPYGFTTFVN